MNENILPLLLLCAMVFGACAGLLLGVLMGVLLGDEPAAQSDVKRAYVRGLRDGATQPADF
jgi:hypothetical protein